MKQKRRLSRVFTFLLSKLDHRAILFQSSLVWLISGFGSQVLIVQPIHAQGPYITILNQKRIQRVRVWIHALFQMQSQYQNKCVGKRRQIRSLSYKIVRAVNLLHRELHYPLLNISALQRQLNSTTTHTFNMEQL